MATQIRIENSATPVLRSILDEIEISLKTKVIDVERIGKIYHSNTNSFCIKTRSSENEPIFYFLKLLSDANFNKELSGYEFVDGSLHTPRMVITSRSKEFKSGTSWILFEHIQGEMMAESFLRLANTPHFDSFCILEKRKEELLKILHGKQISYLNFNEFVKLRPNQLFYERLHGDRYKSFYHEPDKNISLYFNRKIVINGTKLPCTVNQIFDSIRNKYANADNSKMIPVIMGQGDTHHGNIIVDDDIWFIDNEYADFSSPFMELAKAYYNDFIGILFFHHHDTLNNYFRMQSVVDNGTEIILEIDCPQKITDFIKITEIKLRERSLLVNKNAVDILSLNDYLILCHTLTKNPNSYPQNIQFLFMAFIVVLSQFDPLKPTSIYDYF